MYWQKFPLRVMSIFVIVVLAFTEIRVEKPYQPQRNPSEFCFYEHAPSGAQITQARITAQLNEDYSNLETRLQPTAKEIMGRNLERDRIEFQENGLIAYLNKDNKAKADEVSFLEIIGFSDQEIERLLAPVQSRLKK